MTSGRGVRAARLCLLALLLGWFFAPADWRYAIPLWLPFVVACGLELEFAVTGWLRSAPAAERGRAPQTADVQLFGWRGDEPEEDDPAFWSSGPVRLPRRTLLRRAAVPAGVIAAAAAVGWGVSVDRGWSALPRGTRAATETALSDQASRIAGHRARVICDTSGRYVGAVQDADGLAEVGGRRAWLTPGICFDLHRVLDGGVSHPGETTGHAIAVLAHEAWHLRGVGDEGVANCYAFQSGVQLGERLGLSAAEARGLMRQQLADNASVDDVRYLVPAGCHDGGRYDLHPRSSRFP